MKTIDLTHFIEQGMPVYPGTGEAMIINEFTVEKDGFAEKILNIVSHTGTHIDAPSHMLLNGKNLDDFPADKFIGKGCLIDVRNLGTRIIELESLLPYETQLIKSDFAVLFSGWSEKWGLPEYFKEFPYLSDDAANWLTHFNLKGIGVDMISVDTVESTEYPNHFRFFPKDFVIIENLTNLKSLEGKDFTLVCMPLKIKEADGSPIRAFALIE